MRFRDVEDGGNGLACAEQYRGVGFKHSWDGRVVEIQKGGPAWLAGIRVGDIMVRYLEDERQYTFTMVRGQEVRDVTILKADICMEG